jgi:hypothetical protein
LPPGPVVAKVVFLILLSSLVSALQSANVEEECDSSRYEGMILLRWPAVPSSTDARRRRILDPDDGGGTVSLRHPVLVELSVSAYVQEGLGGGVVEEASQLLDPGHRS